MQLIVLGMHRSGTSVLTRLINLMGAYIGPEGLSTGANQENVKGFWERRDVRQINDRVLESVACDWDKVSDFDLLDLSEQTREQFNKDASRIILEMDAHRPWVMKEPRLCLLFPLWNEFLEVPVCIHIYRHPIEVAKSLYKRNNIAIDVGVALWERYNVSALTVSHNLPRVFVKHRDLIQNPIDTINKLYGQLVDLGLQGLRIPSKKEITAFVNDGLYRERCDQQTLKHYINSYQSDLVDLFENAKVKTNNKIIELSNGGQLCLKQYQETQKLKIKIIDIKSTAHSVEDNLQKKIELIYQELVTEKNIIALLNDELAEKDMLQRQLSETFQVKIDNLEKTLIEGDQRLNHELVVRADMQKQLDKVSRSLNDKTEELIEMERKLKELEKRLITKEQEVTTTLEVHMESQNNLIEMHNKIIQLDIILLKAKESNFQLELLLSQLVEASRALIASHRWGFGNFVFSFWHKLLLRKKPLLATDQINNVIKRYEHWLGDKKTKKTAQEYQSFNQNCLPEELVSYREMETKYQRFEKVNAFQGIKVDVAIDIVVCVHNALDDVKKCLNSIVQSTCNSYCLYVVNDGSDKDTQNYLTRFISKNHQCLLIENKTALGYTKAANQGLRASTSDFVILLNSDTIVPKCWDVKLLECGESNQTIGIVGPLSNAASWQSVPERFSKDGDWMINPLPLGFDVNMMATVVENASGMNKPIVPLINGFCFAIKRKVIETIGYLDEELFPHGYGEENDYCLRAGDAGFLLAIADDAYVFHAKSKSFTHKRRKKLAKAGSQQLKQRYGTNRISAAVSQLKELESLDNLRKVISFSLLYEEAESRKFLNVQMKVLFLLPVSGGGGGVHSIVQETQGLRKIGAYVRIAVPNKHRLNFEAAYPNHWQEVFYFYQSDTLLFEYAENFDVGVATIFTSVKLLKKICAAAPDINPAYYIQDYEPWFSAPGTALHQEALESYNSISTIKCFAKTEWICNTVFEKHSVKVAKVTPSLDHDIYYPDDNANDTTGIINISAMIRPKTPRRSAHLTLRILAQLKTSFSDRLKVVIFGCNEDDPFFQEQGYDFSYVNHGHIIREQVSKVLQSSNIFLDLSEYQAFGRTGLEAMACGCVPVLPAKGGVYEYAVDGLNSRIIDSSNESEILESIKTLINNQAKVANMKKEGLLTAANFSIERAAQSEFNFFKSICQKSNRQEAAQKL